MQTLAPLYGSSHENGINRNKQYAICALNIFFCVFSSAFPVKWNSRNPVGLTHTTRQSKDMHIANMSFSSFFFASRAVNLICLKFVVIELSPFIHFFISQIIAKCDH